MASNPPTPSSPQAGLLRLFPAPAGEVPLAGRYLEHDLRRFSSDGLVYTNFITSLDGRVSEVDALGRRRVPPSIANPRDWRLYMELLVQADVVLTTSRHLRAAALSGQIDLLGLHAYPQLLAWRREQGLREWPQIAAVSSSLDFELPEGVPHGDLIVLTTSAAPDASARRLSDRGIRIVRAGPGPLLRGRSVVKSLFDQGLRLIYSIAGPRLLHALLADRVVDRLYLTLAHRLIGGETYDTLTGGASFPVPPAFRLSALHLDADALEGAGQLFATFDRL